MNGSGAASDCGTSTSCSPSRKRAAWAKRPPVSAYLSRWSRKLLPVLSTRSACGSSIATRRGVEPTAYGRALLKCGTAVFDELRRGVKGIEFLADPAAGELRIGATAPQTAGVLATVIDRLSAQYPRIVFHVVQSDPATLRRDLAERRAELFIGQLFEPSPDEDVEVERLFDERLVVLAGKRSRWVRRSKIALSELVNEPWILAPLDPATGSHAADVFRASGLNLPRVTVFTTSMPLRISLLATGRYLTMLPRSMFLLGGRHLPFTVLPVKLPPLSWPVGIVTVKNRTVSPVAQRFIDCARDIARTISAKFKNCSGVTEVTQRAR